MFKIFKRKDSVVDSKVKRDYQKLQREFGHNNVSLKNNTLIELKMKYFYQGYTFRKIFIKYDQDITLLDGQFKRMCSGPEGLTLDELRRLEIKEDLK